MQITIADKVIDLAVITGVVIGTEKRSETHVSSSGGGGFVGRDGGPVSAPTIRSLVTTKHEFWLKLDNGAEKPFCLSDVDIPLTAGQKISMISVKNADSDDEYWCGLFNHNAREYGEISPPSSLAVSLFHLRNFDITTATYISIGIFFLSWIIFFGVFRSIVKTPEALAIPAGILAIGYFLYRYIQFVSKWKQTKKYGLELEKHISAVIKNLQNS